MSRSFSSKYFLGNVCEKYFWYSICKPIVDGDVLQHFPGLPLAGEVKQEGPSAGSVGRQGGDEGLQGLDLVWTREVFSQRHGLSEIKQ